MSLTSQILDGRALVIDWTLFDVLLRKNKFSNAGTSSASLFAMTIEWKFKSRYFWLRIFDFTTKGQGLPTLKLTYLLKQLTEARLP